MIIELTTVSIPPRINLRVLNYLKELIARLLVVAGVEIVLQRHWSLQGGDYMDLLLLGTSEITLKKQQTNNNDKMYQQKIKISFKSFL